MFSASVMKKIGLFAGGVLFGTAGVKILSSKDAKKVYTGCTAAVLRAKDCVMKTATTMQEMRRTFWQRHSRSMRKGQRRKQRQFRKQRKMVRIIQRKERCSRL